MTGLILAYLLVIRLYKLIPVYAAVVLAAVGSACAIFPHMLISISGSNKGSRGLQVLNNLKKSDFSFQLRDYSSLFNRDGHLSYIFIGIGIYLGIILAHKLIRSLVRRGGDLRIFPSGLREISLRWKSILQIIVFTVGNLKTRSASPSTNI